MEYYFISDLHIGGDSFLHKCQFEEELIRFLKFLEKDRQDLELILVGDTFGLWEMTEEEGVNKLKTIIETHPLLFKQFRESGKKYQITIIPGNHDHDLACFPKFVDLLSEYNLNLIQKPHILRKLEEVKIWIEHGSQYDEFNRTPDFGNAYAHPLGYWVTSLIVSAAAKRARLVKHKWIKDIQSVYPGELIPHWFLSNYFYKEMSLWLKIIFYPFVFLIFMIILAFFFVALEQTPLFDIDLIRQSAGWLGFLSNLAELLTVIAIYYLFALLLVSLPIFLILLDLRQTLKRYGLTGFSTFKKVKHEEYRKAAGKIFAENKEVQIFVYGHTHMPSLTVKNNRIAINTGTWVKYLHRIPAKVFFLPDIYYPTYNLNYFKVTKEKKNIVVEYHSISKEFDIREDLTFLQRRLITQKNITKLRSKVPSRTTIPVKN
jgi:UDP-2,3-diacylglucosamine pyrophosphatase LpxH